MATWLSSDSDGVSSVTFSYVSLLSRRILYASREALPSIHVYACAYVYTCTNTVRLFHTLLPGDRYTLMRKCTRRFEIAQKIKSKDENQTKVVQIFKFFKSHKYSKLVRNREP
jgi:hypothetical protein